MSTKKEKEYKPLKINRKKPIVFASIGILFNVLTLIMLCLAQLSPKEGKRSDNKTEESKKSPKDGNDSIKPGTKVIQSFKCNGKFK